MSEMSAREVLAQAIWASEEPVMSWGFVNEKRRGEYRHQADCALKALKANGYAVVELPEPDQGGREWPGGCYEGRVVIRKSDGRITNDGISNPYGGLEAARGHASALLAAAAAAERDSEGRE
ncbi:hypothetical protein RBA13_22640 [Mycobacteroides abscessus subsp. massiliense]|uniref:hypothetical protein n=1 Tax=Mycobacteroides abscessus TaxID=36809 RepID=UPI003CE732D6